MRYDRNIETHDGKTYYTLSAHMMDVKVKVGDKVGFNTPLGNIGNIGNIIPKSDHWCPSNCGVHLHLEFLNGAGYEQPGLARQNLLPMWKYITCVSNGETLVNTVSPTSATKCDNYRKEKLKDYPWS